MFKKERQILIIEGLIIEQEMRWIISFLLLLVAAFAKGQTFEPISVSGFNHDVVAEGDGNSSLTTTTKEMDALGISNNVFCTKEFATANSFTPAGAYGLPNDGILQAATRTFQLAPFDQNNSLYLLTTEAGELTLVQPARFTNISLLALATEGSASITIRFKFSDGTFQNETSNVADWFDASTSPFNGYGRVKRINGPYTAGVNYEAGGTGRPIFNFRDFSLPCSKILESIQITNTTNNIPGGGSNRAFVFAVSGAKVNTTPQITVLASQTTICKGETIQFTSTIQDGGTTPTYVWYVNNQAQPLSNTPNFSHSNLNDGDVITCSMTSNAFCAFPQTVTSSPITITVNPIKIPSISITGSASKVCQGTPITFNSIPVNGGNPQYKWIKNELFTGVTQSTYTLTNPENGDVIYCLMISSDLCLAFESATSNELELEVTPVFQIAITPVDSLEIQTGPKNLVATPPGGVWSGPGVVGNQFIPATAGVGFHQIYYQFPDNECTLPDSVKVRVFEEIYPCSLEPTNLITPNGDDLNDNWDVGIFNKVCIQSADVEVFDRWGKSVFSAKNYDNSWNGKRKDDYLNGVYFFKIHYRLASQADPVLKVGTLSIIR